MRLMNIFIIIIIIMKCLLLQIVSCFFLFSHYFEKFKQQCQILVLVQAGHRPAGFSCPALQRATHRCRTVALKDQSRTGRHSSLTLLLKSNMAAAHKKCWQLQRLIIITSVSLYLIKGVARVLINFNSQYKVCVHIKCNKMGFANNILSQT